jgi:hypothetical protein
MASATRCRCPAMRRKRYCYTHQRAHARSVKTSAERARQRWFESVSLQNARSVQRALSDVVNRLLRDEMDSKQAGRLLYKLQTASIDLRLTGQKCGSNGQGVAPSAGARTQNGRF